VNEEVQVGTRQVQDTKHVSEQVRDEELRSETEGDVDKNAIERTKQKTRKTVVIGSCGQWASRVRVARFIRSW
jgi:hypothetical protein